MVTWIWAAQIYQGPVAQQSFVSDVLQGSTDHNNSPVGPVPSRSPMQIRGSVIALGARKCERGSSYKTSPGPKANTRATAVFPVSSKRDKTDLAFWRSYYTLTPFGNRIQPPKAINTPILGNSAAVSTVLQASALARKIYGAMAAPFQQGQPQVSGPTESTRLPEGAEGWCV